MLSRQSRRPGRVEGITRRGVLSMAIENRSLSATETALSGEDCRGGIDDLRARRSCRDTLASVLRPGPHQGPLASSHPVAVAPDVDDVAVVQEAVDERRSHDLVAEHASSGDPTVPQAPPRDPGESRYADATRTGPLWHLILSHMWEQARGAVVPRGGAAGDVTRQRLVANLVVHMHYKSLSHYPPSPVRHADGSPLRPLRLSVVVGVRGPAGLGRH